MSFALLILPGVYGVWGCTSVSARTEPIVPSCSTKLNVDLLSLRGLILPVATNEGKCRAGSISWQVPSGLYIFNPSESASPTHLPLHKGGLPSASLYRHSVNGRVVKSKIRKHAEIDAGPNCQRRDHSINSASNRRSCSKYYDI